MSQNFRNIRIVVSSFFKRDAVMPSSIVKPHIGWEPTLSSDLTPDEVERFLSIVTAVTLSKKVVVVAFSIVVPILDPLLRLG